MSIETMEIMHIPTPVYRFFKRHEILGLFEPNSIFPYHLLEECDIELGNFGYIHGSYVYNPIEFEFNAYQSKSPYPKLEWTLHGKYNPELFTLDPAFVEGYLQISQQTQMPTSLIIDIQRTLIFHPDNSCSLNSITEASISDYEAFRNMSPTMYREAPDL